jgi:hypothetical protein
MSKVDLLNQLIQAYEGDTRADSEQQSNIEDNIQQLRFMLAGEIVDAAVEDTTPDDEDKPAVSRKRTISDESGSGSIGSVLVFNPPSTGSIVSVFKIFFSSFQSLQYSIPLELVEAGNPNSEVH